MNDPAPDALSVLELSAAPWTLVRALVEIGRRLVAFLPVGALEAHGPHLPLATDAIIAHELALRAAHFLGDGGTTALLLPALPYAPAEYASGFQGTLSIRPETLRALLVDIARAAAAQGIAGLVLVNGHLEPDHVRNLRLAVAEAREAAPAPRFVLGPEWTSSRYRPHLPEEFFRGGAHAGGYETSLVLAAEPDLVDEETRASLPPRFQDLAKAMKEGARRFEEIAQGDQAYFGDPASASAKEGARVLDLLAREVASEVREALSRA
ncbi:creatininase family protein [bacterium]|nr:creatininase family protein [bacterium]